MDAGASRVKQTTATDTMVGADAQELEALRLEVQRLTRENRGLKIAVAELERIVDRDTLTPLFNRRYFINALIKRKARLLRHQEPCALLFVDVDGLKSINDAHGHGAGDFALIEISERLKANIRNTDIAARMGGDEFALLLDHVDEEAAHEKGVSLYKAITETPAIYHGQPLHLSASIGCIMITAEEHEDDLIARADREMYRIKEQKRACGS